MNRLKDLKNNTKGFSVLYVEDNKALRANATKLLLKFFDVVDNAEDGLEGLELFKKYHYSIVITDIKMPSMDGTTLSKHIKKIRPDTKVIIMSAFDDKEYLLTFIELGIFRFLKKPVNITNLAEVLYDAILEIKHEHNTKLFYTHLQNIFNYQSSMVMMIHKSRPILANQIFLDFFDVETIEDFRDKFKDLGEEFMPHDGFLYNHGEIDSFDVLFLNEKKLFHIKLKDKNNKIRHFLLKYQNIPEKADHGILSFDDVTELHLLKLFDEKEFKNDENLKDTKAMYDLLEVIQRNSAKVELHNYYKGLSITNDAVIAKIKKNSIVIKTNYLQEKAIQYERKSIIVSDALPHPIACDEVLSLEFENQSIEFKNIHFVSTSPVTRSTIRVVAEEQYTVSLFLGDNKFQGDVGIEDISIDAVKLSLNALPAGLQQDDEVLIDMVLTMDNRPFIINSKATMLRKKEFRHSFSVVFLFDGSKKNELVKYVTKRQMAIIREFKGL